MLFLHAGEDSQTVTDTVSKIKNEPALHRYGLTQPESPNKPLHVFPLRGKRSAIVDTTRAGQFQQGGSEGSSRPPQPPSLLHSFAHDTGLTPGLGPGKKADECQRFY